MISLKEIILRLLIATLLGGIVGLERGRLERAAGLRTHALVCVGAALFMQVSAFGFADILGQPHVVLDPSRIAAQVVSGIGFLGAGTIILQRGSVRGLTTAASVWAVAAIGLAVGGGLFAAAALTTLFALLILAAVKPLEARLYGRTRRVLRLLVNRQVVSLFAIQDAAERAGASLSRIVITPGSTPDEDWVELILSRSKHVRMLGLVETLRHVPGVQEIRSALEPDSSQPPEGQDAPEFERHDEPEEDKREQNSLQGNE